MKAIASAIVLILSMAACGSIERTTSVYQPLDKTILAGPGDVVLRIDRERSLENVAGKADIWGRKTKEGFTEVRFAGVEPSGVVVLYRKDVHIMTNETTLTRTPMSVSTGGSSTSFNGSSNHIGSSSQFSGSAQTSAAVTTISSGNEYHFPIPSDTVAIRLLPSEKRLPISGYVLEVLSASPNALEFRVVQP